MIKIKKGKLGIYLLSIKTDLKIAQFIVIYLINHDIYNDETINIIKENDGYIITESYCTQCNGNCEYCSLSNYGRDCKNNPFDLNRLAKKYGTVVFEGNTYTLISENTFDNYGTEGKVRSQAKAILNDVLYVVYWDILDDWDGDDGAVACDWDNPISVEVC